MHTITVKLERTGISYNHQLSPDSAYIASCDNQPPNDLKIDCDQATFNQYKEMLRYFNVNEHTRQKGIAFFQEMTRKIFDDIQLLRIEINRRPDEPLHLRLLIEARELVQLPFELTLNPTGVQGQPLIPFLLNQSRLITMTREIRQTGNSDYQWPVKPRILFASASPSLKVPFEEHFVALRDIVKELVCPDKSTEEPIPDIPELLTVLPKASLASMNEKIREGIEANKPYSHIHILAHGSREKDSKNPEEYKLTLHDNEDTKLPFYATGNELAMAILELDGYKTRYPSIVSLMVCDSGNTNDLTIPAGSLAHQLHENGIPCVFASQFPLKISGSIKLVSALYERLLLNGEDPRIALYYVRKALVERENHDWASLIVHVRFPDNIDEQLKDYRLNVMLESLKTSNSWAEHILTHKDKIMPERFEAVLDNISKRLDRSINKLNIIFKEGKPTEVNKLRYAEHSGLMGSAYKRKAEHLFRLAGFKNDQKDFLFKESKESLLSARDWYSAGFKTIRDNHWTGIQYLSLSGITKGTLNSESEKRAIGLVQIMAEDCDNDLLKPIDRIWAWGTLTELFLLEPLTVNVSEFANVIPVSLEKAISFAAKIAGAVSFYTGDNRVQKDEIRYAQETTARQIHRYVWWWPKMYPETFKPEFIEMASKIRNEILKL